MGKTVDRHESETAVELAGIAHVETIGELVEDGGGGAADRLQREGHAQGHAPRYGARR
jgi:hypothetical protein